MEIIASRGEAFVRNFIFIVYYIILLYIVNQITMNWNVEVFFIVPS